MALSDRQRVKNMLAKKMTHVGILKGPNSEGVYIEKETKFRETGENWITHFGIQYRKKTGIRPKKENGLRLDLSTIKSWKGKCSSKKAKK